MKNKSFVIVIIGVIFAVSMALLSCESKYSCKVRGCSAYYQSSNTSARGYKAQDINSHCNESSCAVVKAPVIGTPDSTVDCDCK
jgi:hypothetical protein